MNSQATDEETMELLRESGDRIKQLKEAREAREARTSGTKIGQQDALDITDFMTQETDKKTMDFLRKWAITPHLMDVDFFGNPSFDKWVQATREAKKEGSPIPYVAPFLSDSIDALKTGYDAFIEDFKANHTPFYQDEETALLVKRQSGDDLLGPNYANGGIMNIRQQTQNVANQGRYGDSMLMHVNPAEVQGLASFLPLTQNPQTGQPEAFLPFLTSLLGSYAGVGLFGGAMGSAAAGALGSGLATAIAEGDLKKGIMAGVTGFGLGKVFGQAGSEADKLGKEAFAKEVAGMKDVNALTAQVTGDAARTAAKKTATAAFQGDPTKLVGLDPSSVQQAIDSGLTSQADVLAQAQSMNPNLNISTGAGDRFAAINKNLFSGDTLNTLSKPSAYLPIAMGEGQRGVTEAQEQFERDMAQFELDKIRRREQLFADNPEQIPFSSPFYGASGGIVSLALGKKVPVMPETPVRDQMPYAPPGVGTPRALPQANTFESAMAGAQDYMYMPRPSIKSSVFEDPRGTEVMVENQLTGEMEGTGQFKPPSSYRPGIDPEFNYFPFSNKPATYNQNYLGNVGYGTGTPQGDAFSNIINNYIGGRGLYEYNESYSPSLINSNPYIGGIIDEQNLYTPRLNIEPIVTETPSTMSNVKKDFLTGINSYAQSNPYISNPYISGINDVPSLLLRDDLNAPSADYLEYLKNEESKRQGGEDLASGGLIALANGEQIPENIGIEPQQNISQEFGFQQNIPQENMMPMPEEIEQLTMAITGIIPNGDQVIDMFIEKYGNELFMRIRELVLNPTQEAQTQGMIEGQGGGMDDQVMGMIGNQRPVAVSPGEYIVPADVVSGIGDGSSDAGAVELDDMLDRVRQERTGTTEQAPKLANAGGILPA